MNSDHIKRLVKEFDDLGNGNGDLG
jgi:hypothetical protein